MSERKTKVYVVGHKNPDTDSICSAITYANLKTILTGKQYTAKRAGKINEETQYVLDRFQISAPGLLSTVATQVRDLDIDKVEGIYARTSIKEAWELMKSKKKKTLPIVRNGELEGLISTGDITSSYMDVYDNKILAIARTEFRNIINTLDGELVTGNERAYFLNGKVVVAASSREKMEEFIEKDDLVILGNRQETQQCAIDLNVSCIVLCQGAVPDGDLIRQAKEKSIVIIKTEHDTFTTARLINQSIPVKYFMSKGPLTTFKITAFVNDIKEDMTKMKYRDFPIIDKDGKYAGFISRGKLLNVRKKQLILVDHNEKSQSVNGIEEAEVVEIIDHHRLGTMETIAPVFFRNQPVGCTATIITEMYRENLVEIDKQTASLLCAAIISDTLMFRSPTCTPLDKDIAEKLAVIAEIDIEDLANGMFHAGSNMQHKTPKEICFQDFKKFEVGDVKFGVGQVSMMGKSGMQDVKEKLDGYLKHVRETQGLDMCFFMITNIFEEYSDLLFNGENAKQLAIDAFELPEDVEDIMLKGVVSRKKQLIPNFVISLQQ